MAGGSGAPPNGGWGWVVAVASFFNLIIITACFQSFAVLYPELVAIFESTNAAGALIGSLQTVIAFYLMVVAGFLVFRYGCRPVAIAGFFIAGCGVIASGFCNTMEQLYVTYGIITGIGLSLSMTPTLVIVQQYFTSKRALASGLSMCGISVAGIALPPFVTYMLRHYGWRGTLHLKGAIILNGMVLSGSYRPLSLEKKSAKTDEDNIVNSAVAFQGNKQKKCIWLRDFCNDLFDLELMKDVNFMLYCFGSFCSNYSTMTYHQHIVNFVVYNGYTLEEGGMQLMVIGIASLLFRIVTSFVSNMKCANRIVIYTVGIVGGSLTIVTSTFFKDITFITFLSVSFSLFLSFITSNQPTILVDLLGIKRLAHSNGIFSIFVGTSYIIASPVSGMLVDHFRNYDMAFRINSFISLIGGLLVFLIYTRSHKKSQGKTTSNPNRKGVNIFCKREKRKHLTSTV